WPDSTAGVLVGTSAASQQIFPVATTDGANGVVVGWTDNNAGPFTADIYAQRLDATGALKFGASEDPVITNAGAQTLSGIVPSAAHGAIFVWGDFSFDGLNLNSNIYAQRLDGSGNAQWASNGVQICGSGVAFIPLISRDGLDGAIIGWVDTRGTPDT